MTKEQLENAYTRLRSGIIASFRPRLKEWADPEDVLQDAICNLLGQVDDARGYPQGEVDNMLKEECRRLESKAFAMGRRANLGGRTGGHLMDPQKLVKYYANKLTTDPLDDNFNELLQEAIRQEVVKLTGWREDLYAAIFREGLSQQEAAEELGISQSALSRRLKKLLEELREVLGDYYYR